MNKLQVAKILYGAAIILLILSSIKSSFRIAIAGAVTLLIGIGLAIWHFSWMFRNPSRMAENMLMNQLNGSEEDEREG